jgi:hypothetical protein
MPLFHLKATLPWDEFAYWCEVWAERPFGDERTADLPAALIRADMRALMGQKNVKIEKLMPFRAKAESGLSSLEMKIDEVLHG